MKIPRADIVRDRDLGGPGKAGLGAACAVCCAVPVLIITGALTAATATALGVVVASGVGVVVLAALVASGHVGATRPALRRALLGLGAASSIAGLWAAREQRGQAAVTLSAGIALLSATALLVLAETRSNAPMTGTDR